MGFIVVQLAILVLTEIWILILRFGQRFIHGEIRFYAGGGVVADSELAKEYRETWDKASSMIELLKTFGCDVSNQLDGPLNVGR